MLIHAFITHKKAETFADCQDRFSINPDTKSIALSDGMSQSIFQKYWAEMLVEAFTSNKDWVPNVESVKELAPKWHEQVLAIIERQKKDGNTSAWRSERSINEGRSAGATFVGIRFNDDKWECDVLGDSCLIRIHNHKIDKILSSKDATSGFDNYPDYFDSNPMIDGKGTPRQDSDIFKYGDIILLVSDPFADFLLKKKNTSEESALLDKLLGITSHNEFEEIVNDWRSKGMNNDDSTLIIIKYDETDSFNILHKDSIADMIENEKVSQTTGEPIIQTSTIEEQHNPSLISTNNYSDETEYNTITITDLFQAVIEISNKFKKKKEKKIINSFINELKKLYQQPL